MAKIQIYDLQNFDTKSLLIELTHSEQNEINGGGLWTLIKEVASAVADFVVDVLD